MCCLLFCHCTQGFNPPFSCGKPTYLLFRLFHKLLHILLHTLNSVPYITLRSWPLSSAIWQQCAPGTPLRSWYTPREFLRQKQHHLGWHRLWRLNAAVWGAEEEDLMLCPWSIHTHIHTGMCCHPSSGELEISWMVLSLPRWSNLRWILNIQGCIHFQFLIYTNITFGS